MGAYSLIGMEMAEEKGDAKSGRTCRTQTIETI